MHRLVAGRRSRWLAAALAGLLGACASSAPAPAPATPSVTIERDDDAGELRLVLGGRTALGWQYHARHAFPHWFPLTSPSGRHLLVQQTEPYPHHRAMWIADKVQLGDGPIADFYHCEQNRTAAGYRHVIRQLAMPRADVQDGAGVVEVALQWLVDGQVPVLDDQRRFRLQPLADGEFLLDLEWTLRAAHGPVTFHSDWVHYAWPFLRIDRQFAVERGGVLQDDVARRSQGGTDGQYANWIDVSCKTADGAEGVAVFTPQDGQWRKWLTRDYGTFGPRRPDAQSGRRFTLATGETLQGRVRLYVHHGFADDGRVAARYRDYVREVGK